MQSESYVHSNRVNAKAQGWYPTPEYIATFLVDWAIRNPQDEILEPCCGDGVFLEAIAERLTRITADSLNLNKVTGIEIDLPTANQSYSRMYDRFKMGPTIIPKGFFETLPLLSLEFYDVVIGNPPFVGYKYFFKEERERALAYLENQGFKPSKLTNAWVPFIVAAINLLKPGGRLAMVVPAGLFQVSYAAEIRDYLLNRFGYLYVYVFNNLVFPEVEQDIVLLLGTKGERKGLRLIEVKDEIDLSKQSPPTQFSAQMPVQDSKEKWTQYFLNDNQRTTLREAWEKNSDNSLKKLGQVCSVDIGVVTGQNSFFVINKKTAEDLGIDAQPHLAPIVARSRQLKGITFTDADWKANYEKGYPSVLLNVQDNCSISQNLQNYVDEGKGSGYNNGFKCSLRNCWYKVPSVWSPDAFLFRQIGSNARMILNSKKATCTDSLLRVKFYDKKNEHDIPFIFHNSLTLAFSEIFGRSYGGGVLELMPTEAEKLPIPIVSSVGSGLEKEMEQLIRAGSAEQAIDLCDEAILIQEIGLKSADVAIIKSIWQMLSNRRKVRKRRSSQMLFDYYNHIMQSTKSLE